MNIHGRSSVSARSAVFILAAMLLASGTGCPPPSEEMRQSADRISEVQRLQDENILLKSQLAKRDDQISDMAKSIEALRGLEGDKRLENIVHVNRIDIERLSGGYDENLDGIDDGVVVYLMLYDQFGGALRAAGSARITLLDLSDPASARVIGEAALGHEELGQLWYGAFLTSHYTIKVPWSGGTSRPPVRNVTIVASFTDLLTGRTFEAQRAVAVKGYGVAAAAE